MAQADYSKELAEHVNSLPFKMNSALARILWAVRNRVMNGKRKRDAIIIIDGAEGSGKTVLGSQVAMFLRPDAFQLQNHMSWNPGQFLSQYDKGQAFDTQVYDEGVTGFYAQLGLSPDALRLQMHLNTCRSGQRFVEVIQPRFYEMLRTLALERSRLLLHVYEYGPNGEESRFDILNQSGKEAAYLELKSRRKGGKGAVLSIEDIYHKHALVSGCWFPNFWAVDEKEYERLKQISLRTYAEEFNKRRDGGAKERRYRKYFGTALRVMIQAGWSQEKISEQLGKCGVELKRAAMTRHIEWTKKIVEAGL